MDKRFIVIVNATDSSCHPEWLKGTPLFDLFIHYTGPISNRFKSDATFYEQAIYEQAAGENSGSFIEQTSIGQTCEQASVDETSNTPPSPTLYLNKFAQLTPLITQYWELLATYDVFWFPEDSIVMDTDSINRLFKLFDGHALALGEPQLSCIKSKQKAPSEGNSTYTSDRLMGMTHYTSVCAPLMTKETLIALHPSFDAQADTTQDISHYWSEQLEKQMVNKERANKQAQQAIINAGIAKVPMHVWNEQKSFNTTDNLYGEYRYFSAGSDNKKS